LLCLSRHACWLIRPLRVQPSRSLQDSCRTGRLLPFMCGLCLRVLAAGTAMRIAWLRTSDVQCATAQIQIHKARHVAFPEMPCAVQPCW
jgi:hypothetical protein